MNETGRTAQESGAGCLCTGCRWLGTVDRISAPRHRTGPSTTPLRAPTRCPADLIDPICRLLSFDPQSRPALRRSQRSVRRLQNRSSAATPQTNQRERSAQIIRPTKSQAASFHSDDRAFFCTVAASLLFAAARLPLARFHSLGPPHSASHLTQPQVARLTSLCSARWSVMQRSGKPTIGTQPSFCSESTLHRCSSFWPQTESAGLVPSGTQRRPNRFTRN